MIVLEIKPYTSLQVNLGHVGHEMSTLQVQFVVTHTHDKQKGQSKGHTPIP